MSSSNGKNFRLRMAWATALVVAVLGAHLLLLARPSSEAVRLRNALLIVPESASLIDWAPPDYPAIFKRETQPPIPVFWRSSNGSARIREMTSGARSVSPAICPRQPRISDRSSPIPGPPTSLSARGGGTAPTSPRPSWPWPMPPTYRSGSGDFLSTASGVKVTQSSKSMIASISNGFSWMFSTIFTSGIQPIDHSAQPSGARRFFRKPAT